MSDVSSKEPARVLWVLSDEQRVDYDKEIKGARCPGVEFLYRSSPEDALEEVPELEPDLVVIGMSNDEMDGLEFLAFLMRPKLAFAGKVIVLPDKGDPYPPMLQWRNIETGRSATEEITVAGLGDYVARLVASTGRETGSAKEAASAPVAQEQLGAALDFATGPDSGSVLLPGDETSTVRPMRFPSPGKGIDRPFGTGRLTDRAPAEYSGLVDHQAEAGSAATLAPPPEAGELYPEPAEEPDPQQTGSQQDLGEALAEELSDAIGRLSERLPKDSGDSPLQRSGSIPLTGLGDTPLTALRDASSPEPEAAPEVAPVPDPVPFAAPVPEPAVLTAGSAEPREPATPLAVAQPMGLPEVQPRADAPRADARTGRGVPWVAIAAFVGALILAGAAALGVSMMGDDPEPPPTPPATPVETAQPIPEPPPEPPEPDPLADDAVDLQAAEPDPLEEPSEPAPSASALFAQTTLPLSFDPGAARFEIEDESRMAEILTQLHAALEEAPSAVVEVGGHASDQGSAEVNRTLGRERASQVRAYLVEHGVPLERLVVRNYHTSNPAGEADDREREMDRRVTIRVLE